MVEACMSVISLACISPSSSLVGGWRGSGPTLTLVLSPCMREAAALLHRKDWDSWGVLHNSPPLALHQLNSVPNCHLILYGPHYPWTHIADSEAYIYRQGEPAMFLQSHYSPLLLTWFCLHGGRSDAWIHVFVCAMNLLHTCIITLYVQFASEVGQGNNTMSVHSI